MKGERLGEGRGSFRFRCSFFGGLVGVRVFV